MSERRSRMRGQELREHQRTRSPIGGRSTARESIGRNAAQTRRLIEGDDLLTQSELERADYQIQIDEESRRENEWHDAELDWRDAELERYKTQNKVWEVRAWILTAFLLVFCAWAAAALISGEATIVEPSGVWSVVSSVSQQVL